MGQDEIWQGRAWPLKRRKEEQLSGLANPKSNIREHITCTSLRSVFEAFHSWRSFESFLPPPLLPFASFTDAGFGKLISDSPAYGVLGHSHHGKPNVKHTPRALRRQKVARYQPQDHGLCRLQEAEDQVPHAGWPSTLLTWQEKRTLLYGQQELADAP
jgi:hypothetical protein